jgi:hypothetical protein
MPSSLIRAYQAIAPQPTPALAMAFRAPHPSRRDRGFGPGASGWLTARCRAARGVTDGGEEMGDVDIAGEGVPTSAFFDVAILIPPQRELHW